MRFRIGLRFLVGAVVMAALLVVGLLALPQGTFASPGVDEGKAAFTGKLCANCHGPNAEGGFGPTLAGRDLTSDRVVHQLRSPFRRMPSFRTDQVSDEDAASIAEFLNSLTPPAERGKARVSVQATDSAVKQQWIEKGCAQCHGAGPVSFMTTWAERGPLSLPDLLKRKANGGRLMPAFREDQVSDEQETAFRGFLMKMLEDSFPVSAGVTATRSGTQTTFVIMIHNNGEDAASIEVKGVLPKGATLVDSWAGSGRGFNSGKFDGTAVGWINSNVSPGRDQGPFVFIVDTGNDPATGYAWVGHNTVKGHSGAYVTRTATAAAP